VRSHRPALALAIALTGLAASAREDFVSSSDGVLLFTQEVGQGEPVIVLHGGPGFNEAYLVPDLEPLSKKFRLVYYDQRGAGRSTVVSDPALLTPEAFVEDLDRVREASHAGRVALLGHSWGAGLAALYLQAHPDRVSRLLLVDPIPARATPYLEQFQKTLMERLSDEDKTAKDKAAARRRAASDEELAGACRDYWKVFLKAYVDDPASISRMRGDVCAAPPAALRNSSKVNGAIFDHLGDFDFRPILESLSVPTLVIHGEKDPIPMEAAREWAGSLKDARLLVVKGSGHFPFVEKPASFFPPSLEFLGGRWPSGATRVATPAQATAKP
jgi:proline iminopeptidase